MKMTLDLAVILVAFGSAVLPGGVSGQPSRLPVSTPPATHVYAGEVWTWDEDTNVVTLRQGERTIRVRVAPDELRRLQLHQFATIHGELAPSEIQHVITPSGPVTAVPRGTPQQTELTGTVSAAAPDGRLSITTERGSLHVWVAQGADQRFGPGTTVRVVMFVQPVDYVPTSSATSPPQQPSASVGDRQAGDSSLVTGHVIGVNPGGLLVVESPAGPIEVATSEASAFKISQPVQVRTTVSKVP